MVDSSRRPLVTRAEAHASSVRIADVLTLASVTTVAEARVPRTGAPTEGPGVRRPAFADS